MTLQCGTCERVWGQQGGHQQRQPAPQMRLRADRSAETLGAAAAHPATIAPALCAAARCSAAALWQTLCSSWKSASAA
eukprot:CAMPEP_0173251394 /NCGR_PEP_ID=MMETSP1142-20121109/20130_1 /TAXON_ID=483371 /ORGANISM="non described non described, Strain CCMP2298" /LENGTH=77 /DNA_ID=CAMNT_0014184287 /DNA_START=80 /DNA_END=311 /DNA_ORIENTATION=-